MRRIWLPVPLSSLTNQNREREYSRYDPPRDALGRNREATLLQCTQNLRQRMFLTTLYATGLRFSEAAHLQVGDIDSEQPPKKPIRQVRGASIRVEQDLDAGVRSVKKISFV